MLLHVAVNVNEYARNSSMAVYSLTGIYFKWTPKS